MDQPAPLRKRGASRRRWLQTRIRCGPSPMMLRAPWREADYCVVDVETTGLDVEQDAIVSYGAVIVSQGRIHGATSVYEMIRPDRPVSVPAVRVHNLRDIDLANAPSSAEALGHLVEMLQGRILVAHAAWIEHGFLTLALRRLHVRLTGPIIDTAELARLAGVARAAAGHEPSLEAVAGTLGLEPHSPHHALGDALTTAEVFLVLATQLSAPSPRTAGSLARDPVVDVAHPVRAQADMLHRWRRGSQRST